MFETILKWISENNVELAAFVIVVVIAVYITSLFKNYNARFVNTERECKKIEDIVIPQLNGLTTKLEKTNTEVKDLTGRVDKLTSKVDDVVIPQLNGLTAKLEKTNTEVKDLTVRVDRIASKMDDVVIPQLNNFTHRMQQVEKQTAKIDDVVIPAIHELRDAVNSILGHLKKEKKINVNSLKSRSPFELTDFGMGILIKSGCKDFVDESFDHLASEIQKVSLKSKWDVEDRAENVIMYSTGMDAFTKIKDYLYENPFYHLPDDTEERLDLPFVTRLMGVYLRNLYLEKYPMKTTVAKTCLPTGRADN